MSEAMSEEIKSMDEISDEIDSSFTTFRDADMEIWDKCADCKEKGTVIPVTVEGITKKGVIASVEGIRGFIPASQLSTKFVEDLNEYLNKELEVVIIEADPKQKRLVLSAKKVLQAKADAEKAARIAAIEPGTVVEGTVETIKPYGAFIKIDDTLTGMVHVSQISVKRIADPSKVLKIGDKVKAKVLSTENGRLSLSIKALKDSTSFDSAPRRGRDRDRDYDDERHEKVALPKSESLTQNLGDLLKGIHLN